MSELYFVLAVDDVKPGAADASITDAKTAAAVLGLDVQSMLHAIECDGRCDTSDFAVVPVTPG